MTLEELAEELNITPNYLRRRFLYIQEVRKKEGIILERCGRGVNTDYGIMIPAYDDEVRWEHVDPEDFE